MSFVIILSIVFVSGSTRENFLFLFLVNRLLSRRSTRESFVFCLFIILFSGLTLEIYFLCCPSFLFSALPRGNF